MVERLARIADQADPRRNVYRNAERVHIYQAELDRAPDLASEIRARLRLGPELLRAGHRRAALQQLTRVAAVARQRPDLFAPGFSYLFRDARAVAYLQLGQAENCLARHNPDSCLLPLQGGGMHREQRGSRAAIKAYTTLLKEFPNNLGARWLLNLAYMTVGEYPELVPDAWRIPPEVFASEYDLPRFRDVAPAVGVDTVSLSGGAIMEDFDGDGFLDLMASSWGLRDQLRYFRNKGDGTFRERTREAGLMGIVGGLNLCHADYDNDGDADVLVLRGAWLGEEGRHPNSLLRNNGDGTFADVTEEAGLLTFHPTPTAAWGDFDNDGWVDVFFANESGAQTAVYSGASPADAPGVHPCQLFRNNGDGTFTDVAPDVGVANVGFVKGAAWGDYNNDGRLDLYLSRMGEPNVLFRNDGSREPHGSFTDVTTEAGVDGPRFSFPTWFWDYNNDGWQDLFVAGFSVADVGDIAALYLGLPTTAERPRLYRNNGDGTFTDASAATRGDRAILAMGANFGDLDNDGFLDFYIGNGSPNMRMLLPNRMFRNAHGEAFQDVTSAGGFGHLQKGHGVAFGDIDNDGDQDIFVEMGGAYSGDTYANLLFENPGQGNHWITLQLEGVTSNRAAIGARIKLRVDTPEGERDIYATVGTGGSFGASSLQQEIGLGNATAIPLLEITWPVSGRVQTFEHVTLDQCLKIREDAQQPVRVEYRSFNFPKRSEDSLSQ